jgi:hypothetical protein
MASAFSIPATVTLVPSGTISLMTISGKVAFSFRPRQYGTPSVSSVSTYSEYDAHGNDVARWSCGSQTLVASCGRGHRRFRVNRTWFVSDSRPVASSERSAPAS